jgi:hypothetical protein
LHKPIKSAFYRKEGVRPNFFFSAAEFFFGRKPLPGVGNTVQSKSFLITALYTKKNTASSQAGSV